MSASPAVHSALDALFAAAREADILQVARVKLYRSGRRWRGECPICHASKGKRSDGAFSVDDRARLYHCFAGSHPGGDVIELERLLGSHGSAREAAKALAPAEAQRLAQAEAEDAAARGVPLPGRRASTPSPRPPPRPREPDPEEDADLRAKRAVAAGLWREARPAGGSLVETYLRFRGISGWPLEAATNRVRFHPGAFHHWSRDGRGERVCFPAMVGLVVAPPGPTGGVHVTYLRDDGRGKARVDVAKRMWGPQSRDGRAGGVWLTTPFGGGPLLEGEGIESTLSAAVLRGGPARLVATLSLDAMQGGWLPDRYGRFDPELVAADPDRPGFTWPAPDHLPWGEVLVAVDRDMKPIKVKARKAAGGTYERVLGPEDRARVCAALAEQSWRRAGERQVRILAPAADRDFNNELLEQLGSA